MKFFEPSRVFIAQGRKGLQKAVSCAVVGLDEAAEKIARERGHMSEAVQALRNILEAQPRLAAIMASRPTLEPILDCIHPSCRSGPQFFGFFLFAHSCTTVAWLKWSALLTL